MPLVGEARPAWELIRDFIMEMGADAKYPSAWAVTRELLENTPAYEGIIMQDIGPCGAVKPEPPAEEPEEDTEKSEDSETESGDKS